MVPEKRIGGKTEERHCQLKTQKVRPQPSREKGQEEGKVTGENGKREKREHGQTIVQAPMTCQPLKIALAFKGGGGV